MACVHGYIKKKTITTIKKLHIKKERILRFKNVFFVLLKLLLIQV